jgi:hypothetical protein
MFMYVDRSILRKKEAETRALCITPGTIQGIEDRCWLHIRSYGGRAKRGIEEHLARYGDIKQVALDGAVEHILEIMLDDQFSLFAKKKTWRLFLTFLEIAGFGFSRYELRIFKAWWHEMLYQHRGHTEQADTPGRVLWNGIELVEENLVR